VSAKVEEGVTANADLEIAAPPPPPPPPSPPPPPPAPTINTSMLVTPEGTLQSHVVVEVKVRTVYTSTVALDAGEQAPAAIAWDGTERRVKERIATAKFAIRERVNKPR
jgi:hypothetical protein